MLEWVRRAVQAKGLEAQRGEFVTVPRVPAAPKRSGRLSTGWEDRARHGECGARAGGGGAGASRSPSCALCRIWSMKVFPLDFTCFSGHLGGRCRRLSGTSLKSDRPQSSGAESIRQQPTALFEPVPPRHREGVA